MSTIYKYNIITDTFQTTKQGWWLNPILFSYLPAVECHHWNCHTYKQLESDKNERQSTQTLLKLE